MWGVIPVAVDVVMPGQGVVARTVQVAHVGGVLEYPPGVEDEGLVDQLAILVDLV